MRMNFTKKRIFTGLATLLVAASAFVAVLSVTGESTGALTVGDRRDWGYTDTIVNGGATSTAELLQVYDSNNDRRGNRDIQTIFHKYGIQRSDLTGQTSQIKKGWLNTNGTIVVDGKTVATNAQSLYRSHPGSGKPVSPVSIANKTFYIGPVNGSYGLGADLFVFFKNGRFHTAIQASCANPIPATPTTPPTPPKPKPVYSCDNLTAAKLERNRFRFTSSATAKNGAEIVSYNYSFGDGTVKNNQGRVVEHTYNTTTAKTYTVTMTVNIRVDGKIQTVAGSKCKTTVKVEAVHPKPVYACESLTTKKINRTTYEFTVKASASNGARIVSYNYDFGNGKKATTTKTTVAHDYVKAGTYTATVTVNVNVNGKVQVVSGAKCKVTVKVEEEPKVPVFKCESLTATKISRTEFRFNAVATAENATIKSYTFNFGDGNSRVVPTSAKTASVTHEYADRAASYTAQVTITMSDGKTTTSQACKAPVKVEEKQVPSISIEKTVNGKKHDKVPVGTEFTYEIVVRNTGNVLLKNAVVTDNAPSEVALVSASAGKIDGNTWTHTIPELAKGESKEFVITAKYAKYSSGIHKNTVCVVTPGVPESPDHCDDATTETDEPIEVCDLRDNTIKTIERSEFDESHMTTDLTQCDDIEVCIIEDRTIKTIARSEFDESTMTTDLSECADEETPPELPQTGLDTFIGGGIGLGSITAAGYYWTASRRNLLGVLLNK